MKLATVRYQNREIVAIVDLATNTVQPLDFRSMIDAIEASIHGAPLKGETQMAVSLEAVELLAPLPRPLRNIICVGKNYRAHAKEFSESGFEAGAIASGGVDEYPAVFTKSPATVVGPNHPVELHPDVTSSVDYEGELAIVIGRGGRNISVSDAYDHVFGYTIINDVTARDRQRNHKQWFLGKSLDTFCPMGPWLVTASELDPKNLTLKTYVNDELRQNASAADLVFDIPNLIQTISAGASLFPGDVIATGTPAGVGIGFTPARFLRSGDEVRIEISGIGTLANIFR